MTELNPVAFRANTAAPRWLPDLHYPRWKKWYSSTSWLSASTDGQDAHQPQGGRHLTAFTYCARDWHATTPPARALNSNYYLEQPWYMLAGTSTVQDELCGVDYGNLPLRMAHDIRTLATQSDAGSAALKARVLAFKHTFTFVNFNKHALEIYYEVLPTAYEENTYDDTNAPHPDLSVGQLNKLVIPGVLDSGDKAVRRHLEISDKMASLFPSAYDKDPLVSMPTGAAGSEDPSAWLGMRYSTTANMIETDPPYVQASGSALATDLGVTPSVRIRFWHRLQIPIGGTATAGDSTAGEFTGTGFFVHVSGNWLVEMVNTASESSYHPGEKAYPDQVA